LSYEVFIEPNTMLIASFFKDTFGCMLALSFELYYLNYYKSVLNFDE
jgi:hypothetical protein